MNSLFDQFEDGLGVFVMPAPVVKDRFRPTVAGWVKTMGTTGKSPLPTLNFIPHDQNEYRAARFELMPGVSVGTYPLSGCFGVKVPGHADLISLYEACQRGLAKEI